MTDPIDSAAIYHRHLARVVESSDDAIVSKDINGIITSWNPAAERMFGYSAAEAVGQSIRLIIPPDRQAEEDTVLRAIRAGDSVANFETVRLRRDGRLVQISLTVSPIRDDDGRVIGASKIARDITAAVQLRAYAERQAELGAQQERVARKLSDVGRVVAGNLDRDSVVQKVTDLGTELTGAAFGAFFYNIVDPQSGNAYMLYTLAGAPRSAFSSFPHPRATAIFAPTFRGETTVRLDDVTQDPRYGKSGPFFGMPPGHLPVRSYLAVPVVGRGSEVLGGLFFGHPEPGRFREEHEQLAEGVAAWAAVALENARLYVELREANRTKDEFLAVLSHELRTPLNAILGYARLLRGGLLSDQEARQGFEVLDRNASALAKIIEDVLDVSRIVSGSLRLNVQPIELSVVVHNAIATIQPAAEAKGIRIQVVVDPSAGSVAGDADRLQQVLWNLFSNAVKFTPRGGRVQVRVQRVNSHIEIAVADTGVGIKPDFLPQVFERFSQADATTRRRTGGLGLGLAIVKHIVELHGGTVDAASPGENQGATFRVRLPTMVVHASTQDAPHLHAPVDRLEPVQPLADLSGIHVLAVDDDGDALDLLGKVLEAAGARVTCVASAREALLTLAGDRPDAIVADVGMPEMDGFDLVRQIRSSADPSVRRVPAAALTAFARAEDRTKALQSGFEMHLAKPVAPAELVAAVSNLVRRGN